MKFIHSFLSFLKLAVIYKSKSIPPEYEYHNYHLGIGTMPSIVVGKEEFSCTSKSDLKTQNSSSDSIDSNTAKTKTPIIK